MDGLSHYGIFFRIIAPLSTAIAVTLAVAFFVANWNSYLLLRVKGSKRRYTCELYIHQYGTIARWSC